MVFLGISLVRPCFIISLSSRIYPILPGYSISCHVRVQLKFVLVVWWSALLPPVLGMALRCVSANDCCIMTREVPPAPHLSVVLSFVLRSSSLLVMASSSTSVVGSAVPANVSMDDSGQSQCVEVVTLIMEQAVVGVVTHGYLRDVQLFLEEHSEEVAAAGSSLASISEFNHNYSSGDFYMVFVRTYHLLDPVSQDLLLLIHSGHPPRSAVTRTRLVMAVVVAFTSQVSHFPELYSGLRRWMHMSDARMIQRLRDRALLRVCLTDVQLVSYADRAWDFAGLDVFRPGYMSEHH